ncbi:MAG: hypothetical protein KQJ78_10115 [Deltaproteobacteria bacterium]|nr:hypothetical protein [Deltaproteobacteria bacterium]
MDLDYSEISIGPAEAVWERLTGRVGALTYRVPSLRVGLTGDPAEAGRRLARSQPWQVMKLLWATKCPGQAGVMASRLRSWDAKLWLDEAGLEPSRTARGTFFAYVVTM